MSTNFSTQEARVFVYVQKQRFHTPKLDLDIGESIAASVGYETYGRLNAARDNAILICHHFTGTSHAAGRYGPDDAQPGWWDVLIGPGKPFDTDCYFVVAVDALCNLNVRDPLVITTGPATINPDTGRPYGPSFPQVTLRDNVRLQYQLLESLGIDRLVCVAGPSMGGFQALEWAVTYPHMVQRVVAVAAAPQVPPVMALSVFQAGIDAISADPAFRGGDYYESAAPADGLSRAILPGATLGRSDEWIHARWERKTAKGSMHPRADRDGRYLFQAEMAELARQSAAGYDANHFISLARACILHDIGYANRGIEVVAQKITAELLMLPVVSDLLVPPAACEELVQLINMFGGRAAVVPIDSPNGHLAAIHEANRLAEPIHRLLSRGLVH